LVVPARGSSRPSLRLCIKPGEPLTCFAAARHEATARQMNALDRVMLLTQMHACDDAAVFRITALRARATCE